MSYRGQISKSSISAKDAMKAQMDALMGRDRNMTSAEKAKRRPHFSDAEHNKFFLVGLDPYELFANTKDDIGPIPSKQGRICDASMKKEYEKLSQQEKDKYGYEYDLYMFLRRLISDLDRRIQRGNEKIAEQDREAREKKEKLLSTLSAEDRKRLKEIEEQLIKLIEDAEKLAEEGDVDGSHALITQSEQLRTERRVIHQKLPGQLEDPNVKRLLVCDVSGNFLSSTDSAERMRNHYEGKRYIGWKLIRERLEELRSKNLRPGIPGWNPKRAEEEAERQKRRAESGASEQVRERDRDRDRTRDRQRHKSDRDRTSRDRSRKSRNDRSRSRRSRSRSRGRDRDRSRKHR